MLIPRDGKYNIISLEVVGPEGKFYQYG